MTEQRAFWQIVGGQFADYERLTGEHVDLKTAFDVLCRDEWHVSVPEEVFGWVQEGYRKEGVAQ